MSGSGHGDGQAYAIFLFAVIFGCLALPAQSGRRPHLVATAPQVLINNATAAVSPPASSPLEDATKFVVVFCTVRGCRNAKEITVTCHCCQNSRVPVPEPPPCYITLEECQARCPHCNPQCPPPPQPSPSPRLVMIE